MRWEMKTIEAFFLSSCSISNSVSRSLSASTVVGSSRINTGFSCPYSLESHNRRAISTICRSAGLISATGRSTSMLCSFIWASSSRAAARMGRRARMPARRKSASWHRKRFSVTERLGTREPSWKTMPMPLLMASAGLFRVIGCP